MTDPVPTPLPGDDELQDFLEARARRLDGPPGGPQVAWREWGRGPTLVLTHGSFGSWTHWIRNVAALSARFRVLACDLPGMGESDAPPLPFDPWSLADILAGSLDEIAPGPFHLAGFSFGGIVGGHLAMRRPDRVLSYTAVGSNALGLPIADRRALMRPNREMGEAEILEVHRHNLAVHMIADPGRIDDLALALQNANTRRARIRSGAIPRGDSLARRLAEMHAAGIPIQGIWGDRDSMAGDFLGDRVELFRRIRPDCPFHLVPGAGHWVAYEAPDAVNRILIETLPSMETTT